MSIRFGVQKIFDYFDRNDHGLDGPDRARFFGNFGSFIYRTWQKVLQLPDVMDQVKIKISFLTLVFLHEI